MQCKGRNILRNVIVGYFSVSFDHEEPVNIVTLGKRDAWPQRRRAA
jgi:hypothetical protein